MTDTVAEYEALRQLIKDTGLKMIQWRNFNIDPDWYLGKIGVTEPGEIMGVKQMMELIREEFPDLKFVTSKINEQSIFNLSRFEVT
jgi:hypothetical protein